MARPEKKTVDYFPHQTTHGKTIFILESKFGNDGYAFWFKLLETLGSKDGMFLDCDDLVEWEYLIARAKVDSETAMKMLETLASVGAINSDMWSVKIVFCQNFVDGISDAFKRRKEHLPSFDGVIVYINPAKAKKLQALTGKGKESKVKETKEKKKELPDFISEESFSSFVGMRKKIKKPLTDRALILLIAKLEKFHSAGHNINEILDNSTMNCWQGIFEPKSQQQQSGQPDTRSPRRKYLDESKQRRGTFSHEESMGQGHGVGDGEQSGCHVIEVDPIG